MNVDILCEFGSLNGGENSMLALLPLLGRLGVRARVLAPPNGPLAEAVRAMGVEMVPLPIEPDMSLGRKQEMLGRILFECPPELLHANSIAMGRLAGPVAADFFLPSVAHLRDIIRLNRTMVADLNKHRRFLAVSKATRRFHVAQGLDADRCHVLYNGVDLERFRPRPASGYLHRELELDPQARLLAVIGQIGLRKGQDFLLDALIPVFAMRSDLHLLIVGRRWSGKDESVRFEQNLIRRSRRKPFVQAGRPRVHWLGVRDDVPALLNELTLLVHPARQEPLGRVLLEAAACGVAVVACDVGGTSEIFPDAACARLVPSGSTDDFAEAVLALLDDDAARDRMADAARRRAEAAFPREQAAEGLFRHYELCLAGTS